MHPDERRQWEQKRAEDRLNFRLGVGALVIFISLLVAWEVYKWNDCRKVGHGFMYCVANIGPRG